MTLEGPALETLTRRLSETPSDFLAEPRIGKQGVIHVSAVVSDLLVMLSGRPLIASETAPFVAQDAKKHRNRLALTLVAAWMMADPWFQQAATRVPDLSIRVYSFLSGRLAALAEVVAAPEFVNNPDHREELARMALYELQLRPAGETDEQAQDRLSSIDSVERQRVLQASRQAEIRARAVLEAMAAKAAQDAADKWTRE